MADETASTETSATTTEQTATADTAAAPTGTAAAETAAAETEIGSTALGGAGETAEATTEAGAETEAAAPVVPEIYELAVPEGFEKLDEASVNAATPVFKELGLSNDQANKIVPIAAEMVARAVSGRDDAFIGLLAEMDLADATAKSPIEGVLAHRAAWLTAAKADPEIGGANFQSSLQAAARALDQLGFPEGSAFRKSLNASGYGNHPDMIRAWAKVGKAIGEDTFVRGDMDSAVRPKTDAELFYGKKG